MPYAVKEIFYSLQGEGANAGRPAVFLRFAGCNLWSAREQDRVQGPGSCAAWCDTDFFGTDGTGGGRFGTPDALADAVRAAWPGRESNPFVVCTGGEPLLQVDESLTRALHAIGCEIAVETNGTTPSPPGIDWICVSPKAGSRLILQSGHELKFVYPQAGAAPSEFRELDFRYFWLQPMDGPDADRNRELALRYCLENPTWRLSLQTHKLLGIR